MRTNIVPESAAVKGKNICRSRKGINQSETGRNRDGEKVRRLAVTRSELIDSK